MPASAVMHPASKASVREAPAAPWRQLFVDNCMIGHVQGVRRQAHAARDHASATTHREGR